MKKKILCIHPNVEKYGSDRSFVAAVAALERSDRFQTEILLPETGPIDELIADANLKQAKSRPLWVLRKADFAKNVTVGLPRNLASVARAIRDVWTNDRIYIDTAVVLDFLIAAILTRKKVVVHVREIPVGLAMRVIRLLLLLSGAKVLFNSEAAKEAFRLPANQAQAVVYNGFSIPATYEKQRYDGSERLKLLCIGRLNSWKGQAQLIGACALLPEGVRQRLSVRIVGGVYKDQVHFRDDLTAEIKRKGLGNIVEMIDFVEDPSAEYIAADVVVVPSTLPEPFGRVAIEGMAYECAVIATNHGGLREIVVDRKTGALVPPADEEALSKVIQTCLVSPETVRNWGKEGYLRFVSSFTQEACDRRLLDVLDA